MSRLPLLLLLAAAVAVFSPSPASSFHMETRYGSRNYFCRDRYGFTGDCNYWRYWKHPPREEFYDYGYRTSRYGRKVGDGLYNMVGDYHAEMICDFDRSSRVRDDVVDIVWWKVYDEDYESGRRGRGRSRYDPYDYFRGDRFGRRDHRYRFRYRRHYDNHHYRDAHHYDYRPGMLRRDDYINGYRDWYSNDHFRSSLRVFTQGGRSTLYIRDIQPEDLGLYRCQGRLRSRGRYGRGRDDELVYMDVEFYPVPKYD